jgi:predicted AlkP superfamily phosphohydrolase/phosphomutase
MKLQQSLERATEQTTAIGEELLTEEEWNLFLLGYGAPHRAGHYLFDLSQIDRKSADPARQDLDDALLRIYQTCDRGITKILRKAPENAIVILFAVHGIGRNPGWSDYCSQLLNMIQSHGSKQAPKTGLLYKIRQALPWEFIRTVTRHLPKAALDRLVSIWTANMFDWSQTRYFPLPMDHAGYIRINLKGREPEGIVAPGSEYEQLCDEIETALSSFHDITTGQVIVKKVFRRGEFSREEAMYHELLPDLIITWNDVSAIGSAGVRSDLYGELRFDGRLPSGRAGNHTSRGWFAAAGPGIPPGSVVTGYHIRDLAPTVLTLSGMVVPDEFQGKVIMELCG